MQIGHKLRSGRPHDGRAPDYDDWDLNGDLLFWNDPLACSYELSSMGIRVSPESLDRQLTEAGCDGRRSLPFHKALLAGELPCTIGGGIGQSRLCMLLLGSARSARLCFRLGRRHPRSLRKSRHPPAVTPRAKKGRALRPVPVSAPCPAWTHPPPGRGFFDSLSSFFTFLLPPGRRQRGPGCRTGRPPPPP